MDRNDGRPDPDQILEQLRQSKESKRGRLKIFFGYSAGVGKTYSMLDDAHEQLRSGIDVLVGYIETHTRPETLQLLDGLPALPPKVVLYKNIRLNELDLDAALKRKPELILVDELAHSNAEGLRNKKRYQDIEELLNAGIDVSTTVNVQHIESLNDIIQSITNAYVRETIPDFAFDSADKVTLIDIEPDELLKRFEEGKIYRPERAEIAMKNFFTLENLRLLREITIRKIADRISHDNETENSTFNKVAKAKLLVCLSASESSAKCIRWTARSAEALRVSWTAVYVENKENEFFTNEQMKSLNNNIDLVERLGGEVVILNGHDKATVVADYVKLSGITSIVIGKNRGRRKFKGLFVKDFEDSLISLINNVEIHVIPDNANKDTYKKSKRIRLANNIYFSWVDTIKSIGWLVAATIISSGLLSLDIGNQNIILMYILSVLLISRTTSGYLYGVVSSILSVLIFNFLFTEPYFTFYAFQPGYPITFVVMLFASFIISTLTVRIKTQAKLAVERERRTEILYEINKKLLVTRGLQNIVVLVNEYISILFKRSMIFYTQDPENGSQGVFYQSPEDANSSYMQLEDERAVVHWVFENKNIAGAGTDTLMGAGAYYMPVKLQGKVLGVLGISCANGKILDQNNRSFLKMIASQVAMALERQHLSDGQRLILIEAEKEKMRSNLLRAISHDLRTPLTGMLGSSSVLLESGDSLDKETRNKLISDIKEDSQWLIRMVENLLAVTRINEGDANINKTPEAVEEVVAEAVSRVKKRFKERKIIVKVPDELLLVPMDGTLIEQVIINLLENAVKHSGDETVIDIVVRKVNRTAVFEVSDNGEGISERDLTNLFENNISIENKRSDSSRGMGIGLSICMSIIKAHNGKIEATNKKDGGALFRFTLPLSGDDDNGK